MSPPSAPSTDPASKTAVATTEEARKQHTGEAKRKDEGRLAMLAETQRRKKTLEEATKPGRVFGDCPECPLMVVALAGEYLMGSPAGEEGRNEDEGPQIKVAIAAPFAISKFEVTLREFAAFVQASGHKADGGCWTWDGQAWTERADKSWSDPGFAQLDAFPVTCVGWSGAKAYAQWLSKKTGNDYGLLTEAEWEYAARAGTTTPFSTGPTITPEGELRRQPDLRRRDKRRLQGHAGPGRLLQGQRLRPSRHARQYLGVGRGLLRRRLSGRAGRKAAG